MTKVGYRVWQVYQAIRGKPEIGEINEVQRSLSPELFLLFEKMSPAEQAHAIRVWRAIQEKGLNNSSLEIAALLHDVGKIQHPLSILDRVIIVLGYALFPKRVDTWAQRDHSGLRGAFWAAAKHEEWGAKLVSDAGADPLAIRLVARHQSADPAGLPPEEAKLLIVLQQADNQN